MSYLVVCGFIQIAQLLGLLDHSGYQHLRQDLIAGELGGEPAATLRDLTDEGGEVGQLCQRHLGDDGLQTIIAEVPLAELANFTTFIRQITQGRGWFTTEFARYEILPEMLVPAVVEQAKKLGNLDESADD